MAPAALSILNTVIHRRGELYSLNDLHKAAGGEDKHRPNYFLSIQQTKDLVAEIGTAGISAVQTINGGASRGTYACRELVIAYAAWISAAFHLKVIRVFLGQVDTTRQLPLLCSPAVTLDECEAHTLAGLFILIALFKPDIQRAEKMLRAVDSPHASRMYDAWHETAFFAGSLNNLRERCQAVYDRHHR